MTDLLSFRVFLNKRLTAAAGDIFGAVEQTLSEYIKDNDRLQRKLRVTPQIQLCTNDSLLLSGEVPPEEQDCEQERSLSLVQENPETMQIKEEQEELWTNQEEEQIPGPSNTRDSIFTPHCVKSECDQQVHKAILTEYPTLSQFKMSKLKTIHVFLKDFFTVFASMKIFGAVDKMVSEYQEENDQLRRRLHLTPETELCTTEEVPHEEQQCEQERSPSLRQENPETMQIKEELGELWTNQEEEQSRGVEPDIIEFIIPPSCVKSECDQDPVDSLPQTQSVENRESDSKPGNLTPFDTVTQLEVLYFPREPPDNLNKQILKQDRVTHTGNKPFSCDDCGKHFSQKGGLNRHILIHTGEKSTRKKLFICDDCGKHFSQKGALNRHILIHTGEKPFSCGDCGKSFNNKQTLIQHKHTHTGEKSFSCYDCGKCFRQRGTLTSHIFTHTGEKPFSCDDCGKHFSQKGALNRHMVIHTGEKQYSCGDCGKYFSQKNHLERHMLTHTGEKAFSCKGCKKCFSRKEHLVLHIRTHTGEKPFS